MKKLSTKNRAGAYSGIKAVFFDAGNTLFYPHPSVGSVYARVAAKYGKKVSAAQMDASFQRTWKAKGGLGALGKNASEAREKAWWRHRVREVLEPFGGVEDFDSYYEELFELFGSASTWRLYPGVRKVIKHLKKKGYKVGIISNWDSRLFNICKDFGLHQSMDVIVASCKVGVAKPHPKIFEVALKKIGVTAQQAVHVGDQLEDDVQGASNCGLRAVWIGHGKKVPKGVEGIKKLEELLNLI